MANPMGTIGNVDNITIGGLELVNLPIEITVAGFANGAVTTLRNQNASAGYQVPGGKILYIKSVKVYGNGTAGVSLGYGTSDAGLNSGSPPAGAVYMGGNISYMFIANQLTGEAEVAFPDGFQIPSGDYPFVNCPSGSVTVWAYGYLI